ncbi:hypothetical protein VTI74DRAFT_3225 [Chaetomium olivicolor]
MPRQLLRAALGRTATPSARSQALLSQPTPASFFSTTTTTRSDSPTSNNNNNSSSSSSSSPQSSAVNKLANLSKRLSGNSPASSEGQDGGSSRPSLVRRITGLTRGGADGVDARALRVQPAGLSSSGTTPPKVLNIRTLRGGLGLRRGGFRGGAARQGARDKMPFGSGLGANGDAAARRPRFVFGASAAGAGGRRGAGRFGSGMRGSTGGGGGGRFGKRERGGQLRGSRGEKGKAKGKDDMAGAVNGGKMTFTPEEQAVIDRLEKGEVVPFHPKVTLDSLAGYGAPMATDAPSGQVETVLKTMRLMTGGMAFNSDSGVTTDMKVVMKRFVERMPIFVHSNEEKAWIESAQPRHRLVGPNDAMKKAIIETTILGKYESTKFAEISDVKSTMANYHHRTSTYSAADSERFMNKVLSLLPVQGGAKPAAAQPRK